MFYIALTLDWKHKKENNKVFLYYLFKYQSFSVSHHFTLFNWFGQPMFQCKWALFTLPSFAIYSSYSWMILIVDFISRCFLFKVGFERLILMVYNYCMINKTFFKKCMVEKDDQSSRLKAELEISLFTLMIKNESDSFCLLQYQAQEWHPMSKLPSTRE